MRRRLLVTLAAVTLLAACDPGWPDTSYGSLSVAEIPGDAFATVLSADGSVVGMRATGSTIRLFRLDAAGARDQRWSASLPGNPFVVEPTLDGGAVVVSRGTADSEFDQLSVRRVSPDGVLSGWTASLPATSILAMRDLAPSVRIVALTEIVATPSSLSGQLAMIDIDGSGSIRSTDLDTSTTLMDLLALYEASIAPDGSFLLRDQVASAGATANTAPKRLRRFTSTGVSDPAFGGDGTLLQSELPTGCEPQSTEDVALAGGSTLGQWLVLGCERDRVELVRLTSTGAIDPGFSDGGLSATELMAGAPAGYLFGGMFPQDDGTVLATIVTCQPQPRVNCIGYPSRVLRFDAQGRRDMNWGIDGMGIPLIDTIWDARVAPAGVMLLGSLADRSGVVGGRVERLVGPQPAAAGT